MHAIDTGTAAAAPKGAVRFAIRPSNGAKSGGRSTAESGVLAFLWRNLRIRAAAFPVAIGLSVLLVFAVPSLQSETAKKHPAPAVPVREFPATAQEVNYTQASSGEYAGRLISITGALVSQLNDTASSTVILRSDDRLVSGFLAQTAPLPVFPKGSQLRITGMCRYVPGDDLHPGHFSYVEMRSPSDLELVSAPPWYMQERTWYLTLAVLMVVLILVVRAVFLNWQAVNQSAWIDRSMIVARERSRILELISSNVSFDQILQEICKTAESLLPGVICRHSLKKDEPPVPGADDPLAAETLKTLHEVVLCDDQGRLNGSIVVTTVQNRSLPADREDIFRLMTELASLAMRQSLLYQGLVYHSTHDPLTELPNRRLCESRLAEAISEAERKGAQLAVIYIDINRFKYVNDKFGHKVGDLYLQQISDRLRSQLRSVDTLARIGGDEFVVIAPFPEAFDRAYALTTRLEKCFEHPFDLEGQVIDGSASFGFARYPEHGKTAEELTRHADHAMYIAKHETRISEEAHALAIITPDELELALLRGRFRLAYQPQFSAAGRLTGLEALLRLDDPVLGIVTPDAFISVAEKNPVIVEIGAWALRTALQDAIRWHLHTGVMISIAVNVSVRQLEEPGYAKSVLACLKEMGFPAERLEIELIERSLMFSGDKVTHQLEQLRNAGVRISLDDFGTEQSCLSLLHKLPIDTIKLDRSFIRAMDGEPGVLPIIQAIVSMAHSLGKRVVAEAIEHVGPVPTLMKMGKMDFQGFLLSRPIPSEEVPLHLQKWRTGIAMPDEFSMAMRGPQRKRA